ncbi:MAG: AMP-binding protein, partial [Actinomycetota bacterium]
MNLADFLKDTAARLPHKTAMDYEGRSISFSEMNREVDTLILGMERLGLGTGDRCVLMMPNSIEWVLVYYAIARLGAVVVPVNPIYRRGELQHIFSDSGARAFFGHGDYLDEPMRVIDSLPDMSIRVVKDGEIPPGFISLPELFENTGGSVAQAAAGSDDPFAIIYTSGTTGLPKGAVLTHGNLMGDVTAVSGLRTSEQDDVVLSALPLFHIYGQTHALNLSIYSGLTLRIWDYFDPAEIIAAIEEEEST